MAYPASGVANPSRSPVPAAGAVRKPAAYTLGVPVALPTTRNTHDEQDDHPSSASYRPRHQAVPARRRQPPAGTLIGQRRSDPSPTLRPSSAPPHQHEHHPRRANTTGASRTGRRTARSGHGAAAALHLVGAATHLVPNPATPAGHRRQWRDTPRSSRLGSREPARRPTEPLPRWPVQKQKRKRHARRRKRRARRKRKQPPRKRRPPAAPTSKRKRFEHKREPPTGRKRKPPGARRSWSATTARRRPRLLPLLPRLRWPGTARAGAASRSWTLVNTGSGPAGLLPLLGEAGHGLELVG